MRQCHSPGPPGGYFRRFRWPLAIGRAFALVLALTPIAVTAGTETHGSKPVDKRSSTPVAAQEAVCFTQSANAIHLNPADRC